MKNPEAKSLCILGRQPQLGVAELESILGAEHVLPIDGAVLSDIDAGDINFKRLGGTIKVARILDRIDASSWQDVNKYILNSLPPHLEKAEGGKFTLGVSCYGISAPVADLNRTLMALKKRVKRPLRIVPNKQPELNSAQVLHNKLTKKGAWEICFYRSGRSVLVAQTFFVQDIDNYAARDQARPARDARVGMLPPKLAQILINLAMRSPETKKPKESLSRFLILDPFCGTGVVLQEALMMGYRAAGSDIDPRMVEYTRRNIQWLFKKYPALSGSFSVETADATSAKFQIFSGLVSEIYLGRPLNQLPPKDKLDKIVADTNKISEMFLKNLLPQTDGKRSICLAVPAWRQPDGKLVHLPVLAKLTDMGYNVVKFKHVQSEDLVYFREGQVVARQLLVLRKANK
ncbi:MAG TPA: hypothetical protein VFW52_02720 [Candidatus Saccharimonadales bacterium]|nr:hypothetical protein [Candidatus Saccharimonadales bacterium]